jgi:hypothetical protein
VGQESQRIKTKKAEGNRPCLDRKEHPNCTSLSIQIKETYQNFQANLNDFAKRYKDEIKSDPKFREKFNDMCQQFDVNPMLGRDSTMKLRRTYGRSWASEISTTTWP